MDTDSWLVLMVLACALTLARFAGVVRSQTRTIERDWGRADAAGTISAITRANARRAMEALMTTDRVRAAQVAEEIEANNRVLDTAIGTLEQLLDLPEDRERLLAIKDARMQYLASLEQIGQLIAEGRCLVSSAMLLDATLPALDRLIASIQALSERRAGAPPTVARLKRVARPPAGAEEAACAGPKNGKRFDYVADVLVGPVEAGQGSPRWNLTRFLLCTRFIGATQAIGPVASMRVLTRQTDRREFPP